MMVIAGAQLLLLMRTGQTFEHSWNEPIQARYAVYCKEIQDGLPVEDLPTPPVIMDKFNLTNLKKSID